MVDVKSLEAPDLALIDTAAIAILVRSDIPVVILDARSDEYDDGRRNPGASQLPVKSTASEVESVIGAKDTLVVTYCTNLHCPASMALYRHLKNLGYENVLDYPDGLAGWAAAGYEVEEAKG